MGEDEMIFFARLIANRWAERPFGFFFAGTLMFFLVLD
jgi:hypothetical protein